MSEKQEAAKSVQTTLTFDLVKAPDFRVIYGNGFFIQPDPLGGTRITVVCDRFPYDSRIVHEVAENGAVGSIIEGQRQYGSAHIEREIQTEIATSDAQALTLFQNLKMYLEWRGLIRNSAADESEKSK